jgi:hypothetical protein
VRKSLDLEDRIVDNICNYLCKGNTMRTSCKVLGLSDSKVYTIRKWGNKLRNFGKSYFADAKGVWNDRERILYICDKFDKAELEAKIRLTNYVIEAAADDWKAAAWYLERKHPEEFGKIEKKEITHSDRAKEDKEIMKEIFAIVERGEIKPGEFLEQGT